MTQEQEKQIAEAAASMIAVQAMKAGFKSPEEYFSKLVEGMELPEDIKYLNDAHRRMIEQLLQELNTVMDEKEEQSDKPRETPHQVLERLGGIGSYSSGLGDLSSNPDHLEGFGR